jgi:hypothetical protein
MHTVDAVIKFRLYILRNCELYFKKKYFFPFTNSEFVLSDNLKNQLSLPDRNVSILCV